MCRVHYIDGNEPMNGCGYIFKFIGNAKDLGGGIFDLGNWLRMMMRAPQSSSVD
jgi:hypothetical protein